jgi:hypothetical protein
VKERYRSTSGAAAGKRKKGNRREGSAGGRHRDRLIGDRIRRKERGPLPRSCQIVRVPEREVAH